MRITIQLLCLMCFCSNVLGQENLQLADKLDSLKRIDQKWRGLFHKIKNGSVDSIELDFVSRMTRVTDSINFYVLELMVNTYGYPGYDLVGESGSHNFWLLMQHQDRHPGFQEEVLALMKEEVVTNNASATDFAYLTDRVRVNNNQLQVYGTQMILNMDSTSYVSKPVEDADNLDVRRKAVSLPPIDVYIKIMNERYHGTLRNM